MINNKTLQIKMENEINNIKTTITWLLEKGSFVDNEHAYNSAMNALNDIEEVKKQAESLQLRKTDVSNCCKYKELLGICEGRNLHCSITWQRITDYSVEIYTGYKKSYSCFHYSDGHIKVEEAIESGLNWLNGKQ